ncbi:hypothetical protein M569_08851, partial [Genlisea aurea]
MDPEIYKERIAALLSIIHSKKFIEEDNTPCQIEEGLYLGSVGAAENWFSLRKLNITHILTVANCFPPVHPDNFTYKVVSVADRADVNISQHFDECIAFIDEAKSNGGAVLVHCFAGRSRSATVVVAYLMSKTGMSLSQAMEHVRNRRPVVCPNYGFMQQLEAYEKTLR